VFGAGLLASAIRRARQSAIEFVDQRAKQGGVVAELLGAGIKLGSDDRHAHRPESGSAQDIGRGGLASRGS
jgi:hypothetical protein